MTGPSRMSAESSCGAEPCITCSDEGAPMTVLAIDAVRALAICAGEDGTSQRVEIALVEPVMPADRLLVHAGTAIAHIREEAQ